VAVSSGFMHAVSCGAAMWRTGNTAVPMLVQLPDGILDLIVEFLSPCIIALVVKLFIWFLAGWIAPHLPNGLGNAFNTTTGTVSRRLTGNAMT